MKKNNQLGYILAAIYLLAAIVILFRWASGISPVLEGGWIMQDGHNLLEVLILLLPLFPDTIMRYLLVFMFGSTHTDALFADALVFVDINTTLTYLFLVIVNTISWFFIGKFLQIVISKLTPSTVIKDGKIPKRTKK